MVKNKINKTKIKTNFYSDFEKLLMLGVVLTAVIIGLTIYAYQKNQLIATPTTPVYQNNSEERMKTVEQKNLEEMGCEDEVAQRYQERVKIDKASTAQGTVSAINSNSLTVKFNQGSIEWEANVKINQDTLIAIPASTSNSQIKEISLTDLNPNDNLVINIIEDKTIINNQDFIAGSIFKLE